MTTIAFIGLGNMGGGMAANLAKTSPLNSTHNSVQPVSTDGRYRCQRPGTKKITSPAPTWLVSDPVPVQPPTV